MKVMEKAEEETMGRVLVATKLYNDYDWARAEAGELNPERIRSLEVDGLVDTGATMLVLPEEIVTQLGVPIVRQATVTYANGRQEPRDVAAGLRIEIQEREARVEAIVEAPGTRVLVGQVPLEVMDLFVDPRKGTIGPRPESPDSPLIELY